MSQIVIDDAMHSQFNGAEKPREIVNASGAVLGYFLPPDLFAAYRAAWDREEADLDELDRRYRDEESYTLAEIWKELGVE